MSDNERIPRRKATASAGEKVEVAALNMMLGGRRVAAQLRRSFLIKW